MFIPARVDASQTARNPAGDGRIEALSRSSVAIACHPTCDLFDHDRERVVGVAREGLRRLPRMRSNVSRALNAWRDEAERITRAR
jgi:hypothetical protein